MVAYYRELEATGEGRGERRKEPDRVAASLRPLGRGVGWASGAFCRATCGAVSHNHL